MKALADITKASGVKLLAIPPPNPQDGCAAIVRYGGKDFRIVASWGMGWDHVSVSCPDCCPRWDEMAHIKRLFFKADEWAMELHPARGTNVNNHPYCLHLWRPQQVEMPLPPTAMVGVPGITARRCRPRAD